MAPSAAASITLVARGDLYILMVIDLFSSRRHQDFGHRQTGRGRHEGGSDQVFQLNPEAGIAYQGATGDGSETTAHHSEELGIGHLGEVGFDHQRRFHHADEDVGGRGEALGAAGAQQFLQATTQQGDHPRHDANVVEDGDHRGEEDDDRQHVEGKDEAQLELGQIAEQEGDPLLTITDHAAYALADPVQHLLTGRQPEHQTGKHDLQAEGKANCSQRDTTTIIRADDGKRQDTQDAEQGNHRDSIRWGKRWARILRLSPRHCKSAWLQPC